MERLRVVIGESLVVSFRCIKGGRNFNYMGRKKDKKSQKIRIFDENFENGAVSDRQRRDFIGHIGF